MYIYIYIYISTCTYVYVYIYIHTLPVIDCISSVICLANISCWPLRIAFCLHCLPWIQEVAYQFRPPGTHCGRGKLAGGVLQGVTEPTEKQWQ